MNKGKNKVVPVSMTEEMNNEIAKIAIERNMTKSALVRSFVENSRERDINIPVLNVLLIGMIEHQKLINDEKIKQLLAEDIYSIIKLMK